ncbi:hypothetical protein JTE90_020372 [Oedothorax gibbosus]|uniref:Uncharacterized protein n=1 Tax=Oedothorax gibbosus TaxID=931172 RepID=A0AAV6TEV7_9ARAC|nr:hypothetical protein JTE90_020372 [Oedothorax gibbosus]
MASNFINGQVGKKWKNIFVLIHFFEEKKYSVISLKDATPAGIDFPDDFNFAEWDCSTVVNAVWVDDVYPAYFLKFSENKKELEDEGVEFATQKLLKPHVKDSSISRREQEASVIGA